MNYIFLILISILILMSASSAQSQQNSDSSTQILDSNTSSHVPSELDSVKDIVVNDNSNIIFISGHLKDYDYSKGNNQQFITQINSIVNFISKNRNSTSILMLDANTQFELNETGLFVFSKGDNNNTTSKIKIETNDLKISGIISNFPTSNKMRGVHTAQLGKSLVQVSASIDHILMFNSDSSVINTVAYIINENGELTPINNMFTLTTASNSIPDHAFIISSTSCNKSYGSLNIKGGNINDKAWAEFLPAEYNHVFNQPEMKEHIDKILLEVFKPVTSDLSIIKGKDFVSNPRFSLFDMNFNNQDIPNINIKSSNIITVNITNTLIDISLNKDNNKYELDNNNKYEHDNNNKYELDNNNKYEHDNNKYEHDNSHICSNLKEIHVEFIDKLIHELNLPDKSFMKRTFFLDRGYLLLNFWNKIQNDLTRINGISLSTIFNEWYKKTTSKVPIWKMLSLAKEKYSNLEVVGIQEVPLGDAGIELIKEIEANVSFVKCVLKQGPIIGETQGALCIFSS